MEHSELSGFTLWRSHRRFRVAKTDGQVVLRSRTDGLFSELHITGRCVASDKTPAFGPDSVRNHCLFVTLTDGSDLEVEAGYISVLNTGIAVRHKGELVHESHPGREIAYPEKYRQAAVSMEGATLGEAMQEAMHKGFDDGSVRIDFGVFKRNWIPLTVDILLGLLFYVVAKLTDLTTAALIGAAVGLFLLVIQRLSKIDLLGGLAMFGIALLLLSAIFALAFQSDEAVKYRSSIIGLISAALFFFDGLAGGNRLSVRLMHYLPYRGIDAARLGIGMGLLGAIMAGLNFFVAQHASTDIWLFYSTFADVVVWMVLITFVFRYAQGKMLRGAYPCYSPTDSAGKQDP
jgi:intracellular septation protein A